MKFFDAVIGNPPYQEMDGGNGASARPLYNRFIEKAESIGAGKVSMIVPAKWYAGGKGLDAFRRRMLSDRRIREIVDYEDSSSCFRGVEIAGGVCYFLWDSQYSGKCRFTSILKSRTLTDSRFLDTKDVLIRYSIGERIVDKVTAHPSFKSMRGIVSPTDPFGIDTTARPSSGECILKTSEASGPFPQNLVRRGNEWIDSWNVLLSGLTNESAARPDGNGMRRIFSSIEIFPPKHVCTRSYLVVGRFKDKKDAEMLLDYMKTRLVRFLVLTRTLNQHITRECFKYVPMPVLKEPSDDAMNSLYGLDSNEIDFINSMIREIE